MKVIAPSKAFSLKDIEDILNGCEINLVFLYIPHGRCAQDVKKPMGSVLYAILQMCTATRTADLAQCTLRVCFLSQAGRTWVVVVDVEHVDLKNFLLWNITLAQNSRCAR